jgi:hypothetical protein
MMRTISTLSDRLLGYFVPKATASADSCTCSYNNACYSGGGIPGRQYCCYRGGGYVYCSCSSCWP